MRKALFAGTFDPFTLGHYDLAKRASKRFDEVLIAVAKEHGKSSVRSSDIRAKIVELSVADLTNVKVVVFDGLLTDFVRESCVDVIIRGLRSASDFEYEHSLGEVYRQLYEDIDCMYLISSCNVAHISSTTVRQLAALGAKLDLFVCKKAIDMIEKFYGA